MAQFRRINERSIFVALSDHTDSLKKTNMRCKYQIDSVNRVVNFLQ